MHTVQLLLKTTKHDVFIMEKRFHAISHIHNVLVKHAKKCLKRLNYDAGYLCNRADYITLLKKSKLSKDEKVQKKQLSAALQAHLRQHGLSEYDFQSYIKVCGKQFCKCLSSQQVQKEATRVWRGVKEVLFGNGKEIHFKKYRNFHTICGKTNTNGAKFCRDTLSVEWIGLKLKCKLPKDNSYIIEALNADISYCEIKRMMFSNGWHYYVTIYLKGDAPKKISHIGSKKNRTGVDIGTSTVAMVSDDCVMLKELAPECKKYNKCIGHLLAHMDRSKRASNPGKYKVDGTIDSSNHDPWSYSKNYQKAANQLKTLYRKKATYIKQSHERIINKQLTHSIHFVVEEMSFKGLQRKAKATSRQESTTKVKQKDGTVKQIHKYKKKRRFGKSLNDRAPAKFIEILDRKATLYGGGVYKVKTKEFRASQYNHVEDTYTKTELRDRSKNIGGNQVQRDLYSAFLLKNSHSKKDKPDRKKCMDEFDKFLELQNNLIRDMKKDKISMKQCFGF